MINILYIHGFNSSPRSMKAELTRKFFAKNHPEINFHCPQIASSPHTAIAQLEAIITLEPQATWLLIGSSLGGYFATYLAETYQAKAALINPAVKPFELIKGYLGEQVNPYTDECYQVKAQHIVELKALEQERISNNNYLVMVQTGDEVLDYQQAVEKYRQCQLAIVQGGDHSFIDYENTLPNIASFFNLPLYQPNDQNL
ncbi:YqiA/YcfP family alpha/beta fold hydrolase [Colwellia sp. C1TZA3]|uniref:YqiA/YcfP family alpha/beta fold hydrolase n=1 Tax=Colwellia sp. C1TZA3 TaxID=2508879 RepID=UPI0011B9E7FE|nr:YqiA/YcfP family alpha/beta fold hydrolase [Colwellia sp. C1TZA3]TWX70407.1 esterase YqiA [Colwellia sp. C1TZA3]